MEPYYVAITIGPSEQVDRAVDYYIYDSHDCIESDGWNSPGPKEDKTYAWLALLKRHVRLPMSVKGAGLKWGDAEVKPNGYSLGGNHAPNGIKVTWTIGGGR